MKIILAVVVLLFSNSLFAGTWDCKVSSTAPNGVPVAVAWSVMSPGQSVKFPQDNPICLYVCGEQTAAGNPDKLTKVVLSSDSCSVAGPAGAMYIENDEFKPVTCVVEDAYLLAMCK